MPPLRGRGKKLASSRCGKAIERLPSLGPDQPLEIRVGRVMTMLTERTLATAADTAHGHGALGRTLPRPSTARIAHPDDKLNRSFRLAVPW
jgi:hypothetical protein